MKTRLEKQIDSLNKELENAAYLEAKFRRFAKRSEPGKYRDEATKLADDWGLFCDKLVRKLEDLRERRLAEIERTRSPYGIKPVNFFGIEVVNDGRKEIAAA